MVSAPRPLRDRPSPIRWHHAGPRRDLLKPSYWRDRRIAYRVARELAADPDHIARVNALMERYRDGALKSESLTFHQILVKHSLSDPNPFPKMNLFKGLWR